MVDRIPEQVFGRLPLAEAPRVLANRPTRQETINTYNNVMQRFMGRREVLRSRYARDEFSGLSTIVNKNNSGEAIAPGELQLMRDFGTLIHGEIAAFSRRNLNLANYMERTEQREADEGTLNSWDFSDRANYQKGRFDLIYGGSHPLHQDVTTQRYTAPAGKDQERVGLRSGARVDGLIRMLDEEISTTVIRDDETRARVNQYRHERDVLWTQSRPYWDDNNGIASAQRNLDAYYADRNPMLTDNILRNWLNGEKLGKEGLILTIPGEARRDRRWWLLVPLLLPLPLLTHINTAPCANTGGDLFVGNFHNDPRGNSEEGANAQTVGYFLAGIKQDEARADTDPQMHAALDKVKTEEPGYYEEAQRIMHEDHVQAARRMRVDNVDSPWLTHQGFETTQLLPSCLSPEQVDAQVNTVLDRRNNPQWWHGAQNAAESVIRWLPKFSINVR